MNNNNTETILTIGERYYGRKAGCNRDDIYIYRALERDTIQVLYDAVTDREDVKEALLAFKAKKSLQDKVFQAAITTAFKTVKKMQKEIKKVVKSGITERQR